MAKKRSGDEVKRFYRVALQRFQEAQFLLGRSNFTTAAVYLAGYAAECALKAVLLNYEPPARHATVLRSFKGVRAHDFDWLRAQLARRGVSLAEAARPLTTLAWWSTDLRYSPSAVRRREAEQFVRSTERVLKWMETRV